MRRASASAKLDSVLIHQGMCGAGFYTIVLSPKARKRNPGFQSFRK